jgi:hypothetical protein
MGQVRKRGQRPKIPFGALCAIDDNPAGRRMRRKSRGIDRMTDRQPAAFPRRWTIRLTSWFRVFCVPCQYGVSLPRQCFRETDFQSGGQMT